MTSEAHVARFFGMTDARSRCSLRSEKEGPVDDDRPFIIPIVLIASYAADANCITPSC
jgi:hypothetical protein